MSENNRVRLAYVMESNWGVTPASAFQTLRHTDQSLKHNIDTIVSSEIRSDRAQADTIQSNKYASGGFNFELSATTFDDFLLAALSQSAWTNATTTQWASGAKTLGQLCIPTSANGYYYECTTAGTGSSQPTWPTEFGATVADGTATWTCRGPVNRVINGITPRSMSIEKALTDKNVFFLYSGMRINTLSLNIAAGQPLTGSVDMMGKIPATSVQGTTFTTSGLTAATTTEVMNAIGNVGTLYENGSALSGIYIREITFQINNNNRTLPAIGYDSAIQISLGTFEVTGSINVYFENTALYTKFLNATATSLAFQVSKGANKYVFKFPRIKFESDQDSGGGLNTDLMEQIQWRALYDSTTVGQMAIHKI